jgi:membrane protein
MALIGRAYCLDEPKWTLEALTARGRCGSPIQVEALLHSLKERRLLVPTNDEPEAYLPARSMETISLGEIVAAARARAGKPERQAAVQEVVDHIEAALSRSLEGMTLKDLVAADKKLTA